MAQAIPGTRTQDVGDEFARLQVALASAWSGVFEGAGADAIAAEFESAEAAGAALIADARRLGDESRAAVRDRLSAAIERLEEHARALINAGRADDAVVARGIGVLRAEARLLRRVTRAVEGLLGLDETAFLLIELQDTENSLRSRVLAQVKAVREDDDPLDDAEQLLAVEKLSDQLGAEVSARRVEVIERQAERRITAAARIEAARPENIAEVFQLYRGLESTVRFLRQRKAELERLGGARLEPLQQRLEAERARLESLFFGFVEAASSAEDLERLRDPAVQLAAELEEARSTGLEAVSAELVSRLKRLAHVADRFAGHYRRLVASHAGPAAERVRARLEKARREFKDSTADRVLDLRLEKNFGRRLVRFWNSLTFWLIVAIVVLIAIDHWRAPDPPGVIHWTIWLDTAICGVLLLDFAVRLLLSPARGRWLQRHLLTDLLPSLPYGLLAELENFDGSVTLREAWPLWLFTALNLLRTARPLIRIGRVLLLAARAADQMVERYAFLINQNIVFFTDAVADDAVPTLVKRMRELEAWILRGTQQAAAQLPLQLAAESAHLRLRLIEVETRDAGEPLSAPSVPQSDEPARNFDVDDVIHRLRDLDANQVAELVGIEFAQQLADSLRLFRLPLLRRLPVMRYVFGAGAASPTLPVGAAARATGPDALETTARVGIVLGDLLDGAQRTIHWFADLYGTITGSQFLDRVGMQMVRASSRPAFRMILFGAILGVAMLFVQLTHFEFLDRGARFLLRFLSLPVLVLGGICLIPLMIGSWFRRIANQAADFFDRVAEAQFLSLTEQLKEETREPDLRYLAARVVLPELRLLRGPLAGETSDAQVTAFLLHAGVRCEHARAPDPTFERARFDFLLLFYRDYIDGAFFHRNDTKVANLLLGNVTLENVRQNRLRFTKRRLRSLESIDIGRGKGGLRGAAVWFHCITHSVAQHAARLIIEYNQHCIPRDELAAADPADRTLYEQWLAERGRLSHAAQPAEALPANGTARAALDGTLLYRTTEFNALHFLSADPHRDAAVAARYGDAVAKLMREDRENLVRVIFGTYPMQDVPLERRTFNAYRFWRRYCARGAVFLFPFLALWFLGKGVRLLLARLFAIIHDVLHPDERVLERAPGRASFEVARRKIHRMRRPIAMEALRLRVDFDAEYLGLALPGRGTTIDVEHRLAHDLRVLGASEREWEQFRILKTRRQEQLHLLARILRVQARRGRDLESDVVLRNPNLRGREGEAVRALATAFLCDHGGMYATIKAHDALRDFLRRLENEAPRARRPLLRGWFGRGRARLESAIERAWPQLTRDDPRRAQDAALKRRFTSALATTHARLRRHLDALAESGQADGDPYDLAYERLLKVAEQPSAWTEQMLAVRTVQSLALLDLLAYERMVGTLGNYEDYRGGQVLLTMPEPSAELRL